MKVTPKEFTEALKDWGVLDIVEAIKGIEETFGIKAAVATPQAVQQQTVTVEPVVEEQFEFTVTITSFDPARKIDAIKAVRSVSSLGLKEAKDLVEGVMPQVVMDGVSREKATDAADALRAAGVAVELT